MKEQGTRTDLWEKFRGVLILAGKLLDTEKSG